VLHAYVERQPPEEVDFGVRSGVGPEPGPADQLVLFSLGETPATARETPRIDADFPADLVGMYFLG
jgi:hypothetical protein